MELNQEILSDITVHMKYARFIPHLQRRENWDEIVVRNKEMHIKKFPQFAKTIEMAYKFVMEKKVLPSMRSMQFGGKPIEVNPSRMYNCAFLNVTSITDFSETMFLLLGGTGVGYSVQRRHVDQISAIKVPKMGSTLKRYLIGDSIEGWADAIKFLFKCYTGVHDWIPIFDYSDIRPKGARLVTSGGKAPGPEPLRICLNKLESMLNSIGNNKLRPIDVHDMQCHIADAVLAGGIRRAALICLFDKDDDKMLNCKSKILVDNYQILDSDELVGTNRYKIALEIDGFEHIVTMTENQFQDLKRDKPVNWWLFAQQRGRSNNSAVLLRNQTTKFEFDNIWKAVKNSGCGEPGIYWSNDLDLGTNPCCEIALNSNQFCNLTEINASTVESQQDLNERVWAATILGTLQASYTDFHYLRPIWKETTQKEALLGVSMTGICSNRVKNLDLKAAAQIATTTNKDFSKMIGINKAFRVTCVKPAGTTSLTLGTSSGIHGWFDEFYIRRIRVGKNEAIYGYLLENHPELVEDEQFRPHDTAVISIPQKAPRNSTFRSESALETLERIKRFALEWVSNGHSEGVNTHNVSATVNIRNQRTVRKVELVSVGLMADGQFSPAFKASGVTDEWQLAGSWMWENQQHYNGLAVLPYDGGTYVQAPFETITEEEYNVMNSTLVEVDLNNIIEKEDETDLKGEVACAGGACEI